MTTNHNQRAVDLLIEVELIKEHVSFLEERREFIKTNFSKLDSDKDRNCYRLTSKINKLKKDAQDLAAKAHFIVDDLANVLICLQR